MGPSLLKEIVTNEESDKKHYIGKSLLLYYVPEYFQLPLAMLRYYAALSCT